MSDSTDNGLASYVLEHRGKMKRFHFWLDVDRRIKKLEDDLATAEFDRAYYAAILDGSWPSTVEVMAFFGWYRTEHLESNDHG